MHPNLSAGYCVLKYTDQLVMKSVTPANALCVLVFLCGLIYCGRASSQCVAAFSYTINRPARIVTFISNNGLSAYNHKWTFGDSAITTSILPDPVRTFPRYGTYYVTHVVSNSNCYDTVGFYVTIDSLETPCKAQFGYFLNHATGLISINNYSSDGATGFYFWKMGYGPDTSGFNPIRQYPPGIYNICLTKALGSCIDSVCQTVDIGCSAGFTSRQDSVNGLIHFTNLTKTIGPDITYKWTFGDLIGGSSTMFDPSYHYMYNGKYYVCLTVTRGNGECSAQLCDTVVVDYPSYLCAPHISYTRDTIDKRKFSFRGFVGPEPANTYHWNFGDNQTSAQQNVTHTYADTGSYVVCITSRRFDGCISTTCETVPVYPDSTGECASRFSFSLRSDITDQDGVRRTVTFYNQSDNAKSHTWDFGDQSGHSSEREPSYHYASDGEYNVCLVVFDSTLSCSDTQCYMVRIGRDSACMASFKYNLYADSAGGAYRIAVFKDESIGDSFFYEWAFGDSSTSNERHPYHYYAKNGSYKICLVIRNLADDCYDSTCRNIEIGQYSGLAERESTLAGLAIYPVPFHDVLKIDFSSIQSGEIEMNIINLLGIIEKKEKIIIQKGNNEIELNTGTLDSGVYFIEINSGFEQITRRIIK
jgi:PKD repeat protein